MNEKKIVILTATFGMGHHSVSKALKAEIERVYFDYNIDIVDLFDIIKPSYKKTAQTVYNYLTREFETLYNVFYNYKRDSRKNILDELLYTRYNRRFKEYMDVEAPSIVISTFPVTSGFMSRYKTKYNRNIPLMTVITDVVDSWEWVHEETNQYFVPSIEVKDLLRLKGVDQNSIFVTGIPVGADFKVEKNPTPSNQIKQVLIMSSAMGKIKFDESFLEQLESVDNTRFIIVTGTDYELAEELNRKKYKNIQVLGYVSNIAELMEASDLIYTKPGGVTLFEAINKEIPLLIQQTTVGQEHANIEFIKNREIGIVLDQKSRFIEEVTKIVHDDVKLYKLKSNMYELKKEFKDEAILRAVREEGESMTKQQKWINFTIMFILIGVTFIILKNQISMNQVVEIAHTVKPRYIFYAMGLMFAFWGLESLMIGMLLDHVDDRVERKHIPWIAIKTTLVGQYYSNITPFASGGQPVQLMLLRKHKVTVSNGTAILVGKFLVFQVTVTLYALLLSLLNFKYIFNEMSLMTGFLALGLIINTVGLTLIIFLAFKPNWIKRLGGILNKGLAKIRVIKNAEKSDYKLMNFVEEYQQGIEKLKSDPRKTIFLFLLSLLQVTLFFGITYVIYLALNLSGISPLKVITLQAILYMCVSFIPIPGTVGASEVGFSMVLGSVFTTHFVGVAMLLWRMISYYFGLIFCGIFTLGVMIWDHKYHKIKAIK